MAEQDTLTPGNGATIEGEGPAAATVAQYIKDLSVESPSSPQVFQWQEQPRLDVQFGLDAARINEELHEVALKIEVSARSDSGVHFLVDLTYAGLFALRNVPEEALAPFLLTEAPRLIFPFARQVIADAVIQTGFPPVLLDPIDFSAAYMQQVQAAQGQGGNGGGDLPGSAGTDQPPSN